MCDIRNVIMSLRPPGGHQEWVNFRTGPSLMTYKALFKTKKAKSGYMAVKFRRWYIMMFVTLFITYYFTVYCDLKKNLVSFFFFT